MRWKPGQHCFLRFTGFGLQAFSSHPFTICSLPSIQANEKSELVFYIRNSLGLTKKILEHAQKNPGDAVSVLIDGPYGGINMQRFSEADRLLVVAGGSGAGWILAFLELFCRQRSAIIASESTTDKSSTAIDEEKQSGSPGFRRNLRIILATRDEDSRSWFLATVAELFAKYSLPQQPNDIDIEVHLTGNAEQSISNQKLREEKRGASSSSSEEIQIKTLDDHVNVAKREQLSRPDLPSIVREEGERVAGGGKALSVYMCGPITMQNDVRNTVAKENLGILQGTKSGGAYLHSEHFSWA